jgi:hypothetical protein
MIYRQELAQATLRASVNAAAMAPNGKIAMRPEVICAA